MKYLFAFLVLLSACSSAPSKSPKQQLRLNLPVEPPTLDLRKANDTTSVSIISLCFEGLMSRDQEGKIQYAVARDVKISSDLKTYTFYLHPSQWSDGTPLTAHDFEETWKTILSPTFNSPFASDLFVIDNAEDYKRGAASRESVGVKALDDATLHVTLQYPVPFFLKLVASHAFFAVPSHIAAAHPEWANEAGPHFVGNGPFKLVSWRHSNDLIVEKNPLYWNHDAVHLEQVSFSMVQDENTELNLFERGDLDWTGKPFSTLPLDSLPTLKKNPLMVTYPIAGTYYYIFNTTASPFDNLNMRKAFALAINRLDIITHITQSDQIAATGLVPPMMWKEREPIIYFQDGDVEEARRLFALALKEMGKSLSTLPHITLLYNTADGHHKIAQAIQEQWFQAFGVRVSLENREWKVFLDEVGKGSFQLARMGGIASFDDPTSFLDFYRDLSSSNNYSQWHSPKFTSLLESATRLSDEKERLSVLKQAERFLISEMPVIPIYFYTFSYLKQPYVKDVFLSDLGDADLKSAYIQRE